MIDHGDWRFHILRDQEKVEPSTQLGETDVSESLIVEVRRLRDGMENIRERLASLVRRTSLVVVGDEEVDDLLDLLEREVDHLVDQREGVSV